MTNPERKPAIADVNKRPYAKLSELYEGASVQVDDGFDCAEAWAIKLVGKDDKGLFFDCNEGKHYLDGQADDGEHCVGIYKVLRS